MMAPHPFPGRRVATSRGPINTKFCGRSDRLEFMGPRLSLREIRGWVESAS